MTLRDDAVRRTHSVWFHFTKEPRYFSGVDEIREPQKEPERSGSWNGSATGRRGTPAEEGNNWEGWQGGILEYNPLGRLPGSVWTIPPEPLLIPDDTRQLLDLPDHFAAFPQEWPRRIITGWSPTGICTVCGEGRRPVVEAEYVKAQNRIGNRFADGLAAEGMHGQGRPGASDTPDLRKHVTIDSYACACPTPDATTTPSLVVDPFGGTGTVAGVAKTLGRFGISNDLSESYNRLAIWRITQSGHFTKTEQRAWADRQGTFI